MIVFPASDQQLIEIGIGRGKYTILADENKSSELGSRNFLKEQGSEEVDSNHSLGSSIFCA